MPVVHKPEDFLASIAKLPPDAISPRPLSLRTVPVRLWRKILTPYPHEPSVSDAVRAWLENSVLPPPASPSSPAPSPERAPEIILRFATVEELVHWVQMVLADITPQQTSFLQTTLQFRLIQRSQE